MNEVRFCLSISTQDFLAYYKGVARYVVVHVEDGRTLQLPASVLRRFLVSDGIYGEFSVRFDDNNKLQDIRRLK